MRLNINTILERWLHRQWQKRGLFSVLMRPFSALAALYIRRKALQPRATPQLPAGQALPPIIIVGNIIVGGAGKTPVVLALCDYLQQQGWHPGVISRGYGIKITGAARVGQGQLDAAEFGDEPSLIAQQSGVPIAVHPKRITALEALCTQHPAINVIIADDGLQHQALPRDIEIIVQDDRGLGNGLLLPAGPLREPPQRLNQADWLITQTAQTTTLHAPSPHSVTMQLWPSYFEQLNTGLRLPAAQWLTEVYTKQSCSALAAIGQPQRFFSMLKQFGITLHNSIALADHQQASDSIFSRIPSQLLLITAKDAVKYQQLNDDRLWVVHVSPQFTPATWLARLAQQLRGL